MLLQAAGEHGIDLAGSFMVGDKAIDIECGKRAGTRTILVLTGYGAEQECTPDLRADRGSGRDRTSLGELAGQSRPTGLSQAGAVVYTPSSTIATGVRTPLRRNTRSRDRRSNAPHR